MAFMMIMKWVSLELMGTPPFIGVCREFFNNNFRCEKLYKFLFHLFCLKLFGWDIQSSFTLAGPYLILKAWKKLKIRPRSICFFLLIKNLCELDFES